MNGLELYRPNVGVVLFHHDGRVWLGRRVNTPGPRNWQFPQGGVDPGEELLAAAERELFEETGAKTFTLLGRTDGWITYDFPADHGGSKQARGWRGQRQAWFALRFDGDESEFDLNGFGHPEFDTWRWGYLQEAPALVIPFKQQAYEQVVEAFEAFAARPSHGHGLGRGAA
jgi:putative (di)nucleoside polyphosphate hydrolase